MKLPVRFARSARKVFFFIHLWTGLVLGLWFALVGVTGSVLAWMPELVSRELRAAFPYERSRPDTPQIPLSHALAAMQQAQPDMPPEELSLVVLPGETFPYYICFRPKIPFENALFVIDPYSGTVHAPCRRTDFWIGKIASLHTDLLLGIPGFLANGIFSIFGVLLLLSGLWLWWPSTVALWKERLSIRRDVSLRRFFIDLHNVMGIYLYPVVFVTTFTAVLLIADLALSHGIEKGIDRAAGVPTEEVAKIIPVGKRLTDDALVRIVEGEVPDSRIEYVTRPIKPDAPFVANLKRPGPGIWTESEVTIDPYSGRVLKVTRDRTGSPGRKTMSLAEDLHFGVLGGIGTKLLYTIAGLMPLGLCITGFGMWWKRKQAQASRATLKRERKKF